MHNIEQWHSIDSRVLKICSTIYRFSYLSSTIPPAAQRFALLALGRAWILFGSRENSKPEKCSKSRTVPTCRLHALFGGVILRQSVQKP